MTVTPFHSGSQAADWEDHNCSDCIKNVDAGDRAMNECPLLDALLAAWFTDGTVSEDIAVRMGFTQGPPFAYIWNCPEKVTK